jgi:hypothetical protein
VSGSKGFSNPKAQNKTEKVEEAKVEEEAEVKPEANPKQAGWTPEDMMALVKLAMEFLGTNLADKYLTYKKNEAESRRHHQAVKVSRKTLERAEAK